MSEGDELGETIDKLLLIVVIFSTAIILQIGLELGGEINYTSFSPPYPLFEWVQMIGVGISALLTLLLAGIYLQQNRILKEQREWEQEPQIYVSEIVPDDRTAGHVYVSMSNVGNGAARNLEFELKPVVDESELDGWYFEETVNEPELVKDSEYESVSASSNCLMPDEKEEQFRLSFSMRFYREGSPRESLDNSPSFFQLVSEKMSEMGHDRIRLKLILRYQDSRGKDYSQEVVDLLMTIKGRTSLRESLLLSVGYEDEQEPPYLFNHRRGQLPENSIVPDKT